MAASKNPEAEGSTERRKRVKLAALLGVSGVEPLKRGAAWRYPVSQLG